MRNSLIAALLVLAAAAPQTFAVTVDRTAVAVGTKVITESEIVRRVRLTAFQNGALPDFSVAGLREAAQRLIEVKLIEREMDLGHYDRTPPDQAKLLLAGFTAEHFKGSPEALRLALANASLTVADLQAELAEQADLLSFLNLRFRPAVEVSDADIEKYFHEKVEPGPSDKKSAASPVALGDVRASIEQILIGQRADQELDRWLQDQRKRTRINYLMKELE